MKKAGPAVGEHDYAVADGDVVREGAMANAVYMAQAATALYATAAPAATATAQASQPLNRSAANPRTAFFYFHDQM